MPYLQRFSATYEPSVAAAAGALRAGVATLKQAKLSGALPLLLLPERTDDLGEIQALAKRLRDTYARLIVIATGGSSLGGQALAALTASPLVAPKVIFIDNVDPATTSLLLASLNFQDTAFLVISKSGATAETLSQALVFFEAARTRLGAEEAAKRFTVLTMPGDNPLRAFAAQHGLRTLDHDPKLGGRFSVFSAVGLIPAAFAGLNIRALRKGAAQVMREFWERAEASEPARGAALHAALMPAHGVSVWMPYADRLKAMGQWYLQIWSESLGKNGKGSTPALAVGALDQHSQLQLYLDGPRAHFLTLLLPNAKGKGAPVPLDGLEGSELSYLCGHTLGDVMDAEQRATAETLERHGRPSRLFLMEALDETTVGALMMHFMLETILVAHLIGVDAFDQPAVEEGKRLAREYLRQNQDTKAAHG